MRAVAGIQAVLDTRAPDNPPDTPAGDNPEHRIPADSPAEDNLAVDRVAAVDSWIPDTTFYHFLPTTHDFSTFFFFFFEEKLN